MSKIQTLSIDLLRLDGDTQARIAIHPDTVDDYADLILTEGEWPFEPIDVFHDGTEYFLADGFHRTLAAIRLKRASIQCRVHNGTAKDAKIFGMTANDLHGLRMSREDKRACVIWLLDNGGKMTQVDIASKAGVSDKTVKRIVAERKEASEKGTMSPSSSKTRVKSSEPEHDEPNDPEIPDSSGDESCDVPFDAPDTFIAKPEQTVSAADQAKLNRKLAQQLIDKAVRAVDDLHSVKPNQAARAKVVKMLQDAGGLLW